MKKEQILKIPGLIAEGKTLGEVAVELGVPKRTIEYWIPRLRGEGIDVKTKRGPKKIKLN